MKSKKKTNTKLSETIKTKKVERCKKPYLFINIYGTINFLLSAYLLKNTNQLQKDKVNKSYKRFIGEHCENLKDCRVFDGCYLGSKVNHSDFEDKINKFNKFKKEIDYLIVKKENLTLRKYISFIDLLLSQKNSNIKFVNSEESVERYHKFFKRVEKNHERPFMIGFSFVQSLILLSPYFLHFKILTAYNWNLDRNNYFINLLKRSISNKKNAYIILPCFLNPGDCISKNNFRVTIFEIGNIIKSGYTIKEIFPNNKNVLEHIKKSKNTSWNYPELFRFFEISKDKTEYNIPKRITLPKKIGDLLEHKLSIKKFSILQELYGVVWLKKNNFLRTSNSQKVVKLH